MWNKLSQIKPECYVHFYAFTFKAHLINKMKLPCHMNSNPTFLFTSHISFLSALLTMNTALEIHHLPVSVSLEPSAFF